RLVDDAEAAEAVRGNELVAALQDSARLELLRFGNVPRVCHRCSEPSSPPYRDLRLERGTPGVSSTPALRHALIRAAHVVPLRTPHSTARVLLSRQRQRRMPRSRDGPLCGPRPRSGPLCLALHRDGQGIANAIRDAWYERRMAFVDQLEAFKSERLAPIL